MEPRRAPSWASAPLDEGVGATAVRGSTWCMRLNLVKELASPLANLCAALIPQPIHGHSLRQHGRSLARRLPKKPSVATRRKPRILTFPARTLLPPRPKLRFELLLLSCQLHCGIFDEAPLYERICNIGALACIRSVSRINVHSGEPDNPRCT